MTAISTALPTDLITALNSFDRNPVDSHDQRLADLRQNCLDFLASNKPPSLHDVEMFFDLFWVFYPNLMDDDSMAQLAGTTTTYMNAYYRGEAFMPMYEWQVLMVNAINVISNDQLSIALAKAFVAQQGGVQ